MRLLVKEIVDEINLSFCFNIFKKLLNIITTQCIMSRENHNKMAMIENLIWEIAKILKKDQYIDPKKIVAAKDTIIKLLSSD